MVVSLFLFLHYKGLSCKLSTIFLQFSAKFAKLPFICGKCTYSDIKTSKNIFFIAVVKFFVPKLHSVVWWIALLVRRLFYRSCQRLCSVPELRFGR